MRLVTILLVLFGLSACTGPDVNTPEVLHQRWIEAVQANDNAALTEMIMPHGVSYAQAFQVADLSTGALESVAVLDKQEQVGGAAYRYSLWQFSTEEQCFLADMVESEGEWRVNSWGTVAMAQCTE